MFPWKKDQILRFGYEDPCWCREPFFHGYVIGYAVHPQEGLLWIVITNVTGMKMLINDNNLQAPRIEPPIETEQERTRRLMR